MTQAIQSARPDVRPPLRGVRLNLHEGWIAGILLALILVSVTASLAVANWVDGLWLTTWAALAGMLFGGLVSRLRLNGLLALVLALIVGTAFVAWLVSAHVIAPPDAIWNEKMVLIEERIDEWLVRVLSGGIGTDAFVFLCVMAGLGWFLGYVGAWSVFRHHQAWGAILPAGAALLINLFYAPPQTGIYLFIFLLAALLLLVRTTLLKRQEAWSAYAVRFANDIGLDFLIYGVVFSGIIILLAWLIPPTAPGPMWFGFILDRVREPLQTVQDDVSRAFSTVRGTNSAPPTTYFGSNLSMGGPVRLGSREVFQIESPFGRYWRAAVFDKYTGSGWVSTANETASFTADDPRLKTMPMSKREVFTETVQVRLPTDNLVVSASQPVNVAEPTEAKFTVGRVNGSATYLDIASIRLQQLVQLGERYTVSSSVSSADEGSLRAASTDIPNYIRQEYMDVPSSVPARVRDLAQKLTAGSLTNYDKAVAIQNYLREHITYNASVDPVPVGWDGVDYVLFERTEGYCNYYASAMAMMARIIGIPSRVASGYATDRSDDGIFHVNESNAHSWPELYFGDLGWVEFEPTAGQPEINRPAPSPADDPTNKLLAKNQPDDPSVHIPNEDRYAALDAQKNARNPFVALISGTTGIVMGIVLAIGLLLAGTLTLVQVRWQRKLRTLKPGAQAVAQMYRFAPFAGLRERSTGTADERAQELAAMMPAAQVSIDRVNSYYVRERYGALDLDTQESTHALATATLIQKHMWRTIFDRYVLSRIRAAREAISKIPKEIRDWSLEIRK